MAMGMLYDLACRSTKSLMRQLNVWVRGVWVWPFNDKDVSLSLASLLQSPQYNLETAMAAMDRNCGALANITRYHKSQQLWMFTPNTYRKIPRNLSENQGIRMDFTIVWPIPSETTPHCCYILLHIAQLFSGEAERRPKVLP
jgi:hypothetical protein